MLSSGLYIIFVNDTEVMTRKTNLEQNSFSSSRMPRQIFYLQHLSGDTYAIKGPKKNTIVTYESSENNYVVQPIAGNPGITKQNTSKFKITQNGSLGPSQDDYDGLERKKNELSTENDRLDKKNKMLSDKDDRLDKMNKRLKLELEDLRKKCSNDDSGLRLFIEGCGDWLAQLRGYMQAGQVQMMYPWLIDLDARVRNFIQQGYRYA
ncbi:hypothetical protein AUD_0953 [Aspergillus terreus]|uniref:Uncharacterized protein n=1 Tax=Aspergillus terreus TaxID=33178 RepID=A0A5M3ZCH7_ASPTE|nr:hypothetical protein ATETN484_0014027100 [Aspergillus terreus]GFF20937.1 hypothetical protein AUD_0953 [Aspergillus terreus]